MDQQEMIQKLLLIKKNLGDIQMLGHHTGYDWNDDPKELTLIEGETENDIDELLCALGYCHKEEAGS